MARFSTFLAVCGLVLVAGCLGGPASTSSPTAKSSPTATESPPAAESTTSGPPATPTVSAESAGERAVAAEQDRVEGIADGYGNLTGLGFGILDPAEHEVVRRNATGVAVRVDVGYSVSVDCDGDGDPDRSLDGANTVATYLVTEERVHLLEVSQDFLDPARYCYTGRQ